MHNPEPTEIGTVVDPHILMRFPATEDDGYDIKITASGLDGADELVVMLLMAIEQITGVGSDLYVQQIDIIRHAAGRGPLVMEASS